MTIEEAIKDISENILPIVGGKSLRMAVEALEKQIPKKPIDEYHRTAYCPACGNLIIDTYCCPECGQKIDWSDDNDS